MSKPTSGLRRHPVRMMIGQSIQTTLLAMEMNRRRCNALLDSAGYCGRRVMGYKLPDWQRGASWSDEQCSRFIESLWGGVGVGTFMVNTCSKICEIDNILLDGQQRLRAIERYLEGEIAVVGEDGNAYAWTELTTGEQAHLLRIGFPWIESNYQTEVECVQAYNRHNFGGTPHAPCEVAVMPS